MSAPSFFASVSDLEIGGHAGPQQHVVDGLGDLAGADAAEMQDTLPTECRTSAGLAHFEPLLLTARIDGQRAIVRQPPGRAPPACRARPMPFASAMPARRRHSLGRNRAGDADHRAGREIADHTGRDVLDLRIGLHHDDHHIGLLCRLPPPSGRCARRWLSRALASASASISWPVTSKPLLAM